MWRDLKGRSPFTIPKGFVLRNPTQGGGAFRISTETCGGIHLRTPPVIRYTVFIMVILKPFKAIRFAPSATLGDQLAPPYDVISKQDQSALYQQHPHNIVRIDFGQYEPHNPPHNTVYTRAYSQLTEWLQSGVLQRDQRPAYYIYRHTYILPTGESKSLTGVMGALQLHPFEAGQVIPHENTMPGPIEDRLALTHHCQANLSPIYTLIDDPNHDLNTLMATFLLNQPSMTATTTAGTYELWVIDDTSDIHRVGEMLASRPVVIADGHHRYTTALHYQAWAKGQPTVPDPESDYTLAFVTAAQHDGITIYPTHRGVYDCPFFDSNDWLDRIRSVFDVSVVSDVGSFTSRSWPMGTIGLVHSRDVWVLSPPDPAFIRHYFPTNASLALRELDVSILQQVILIGLLGMDLDTIAAKQRIRYYKSVVELESDVATGVTQAGFLMQAPPLSALTTICIEGEKMPQKSTYFYPKLITGLVMNPVDPGESSYSIHQETRHEHTH